MRQNTLLAQAGSRKDPLTGAISAPLHTSAAFQHPALGQSTGFDYSRTANPTRQILEETFALLDGGARAVAFSSGLASIDAVLRLFNPGDTLIVTEDLYGGTFRLFEKFGRISQLKFIYVDTSDTLAVAEALARHRAKGLFVENPTNPLLKVADLEALGKLAHEHGALFVVDNTFLTPVLCRPLDFGADITVYSATKYIGGHNDLIAGLAVAASEELGEKLAFIQNAAGAILGPFESWLLLRSLKTLSLRLARHQQNAQAVAEFLSEHPKVGRIYYPGLKSDLGHETLTRLTTGGSKQEFASETCKEADCTRQKAPGYGAIISFEVGSRDDVERILRSVKVFLFAESLGGTESLVTFPVVQTHADIEPETQARLGLSDRLLRLSIGLEDEEDLIADLASVLG